MDFNWTPYFGSFWIFPLLCLLFMGVMMFACRGMAHRFGHGGRGRDGGRPAREALASVGAVSCDEAVGRAD